MSTCRICKSSRDTHRMVKYSTRHYAHYECYLDAGKSLDDLHDWQICQFPALLLRERGLLPIAEAAYAREKHKLDIPSSDAGGAA